MEVTSAYLYVVNTLPNILEAVQRAQVPDKFTNAFLQALGFKSTNDRAFINVWKGLGFLDGSSTPTEHYRQFRDKSVAKAVLARQIRVAYRGLFNVDENAHKLSLDAVKGKLATLTGKDEAVVKKMAQTFLALCKEADFSAEAERIQPAAPSAVTAADVVVESPALDEVTARLQGLAFSHTLYINLPATRDIAVYDHSCPKQLLRLRSWTGEFTRTTGTSGRQTRLKRPRQALPTLFTAVWPLSASARRLGQACRTDGDLVSSSDGAPLTMKDLTRPKQRFQTCLGQ